MKRSRIKPKGKRYTPAIVKKAVRMKVIARDGDRCLLCGTVGGWLGLHLHRVRYGSEGGTYTPDNCCIICPTCHEIVHSNKRKWQPILLKHLEKRHDANDDAGTAH